MPSVSLSNSLPATELGTELLPLTCLGLKSCINASPMRGSLTPRIKIRIELLNSVCNFPSGILDQSIFPLYQPHCLSYIVTFDHFFIDENFWIWLSRWRWGRNCSRRWWRDWAVVFFEKWDVESMLNGKTEVEAEVYKLLSLSYPKWEKDANTLQRVFCEEELPLRIVYMAEAPSKPNLQWRSIYRTCAYQRLASFYFEQQKDVVLRAGWWTLFA